ncbi:MAG TPA: hypothetical protein VF042_01660, partial [Gemmatimonadaceae bacterium]
MHLPVGCALEKERDASTCAKPHAIWIGIDGGYFNRKVDTDQAVDLILAPEQQIRIGGNIARRVRLEVPISLLWTRLEGFDPVSTTV